MIVGTDPLINSVIALVIAIVIWSALFAVGNIIFWNEVPFDSIWEHDTPPKDIDENTICKAKEK